MATHRIQPEGLSRALKAKARQVKRAVEQSLRPAAQRGKAHLTAEVARQGMISRGTYKRSFRVTGGRGGAELTNVSPIAGIIEVGARPHKVSPAGVEAIRSWVARKVLRIKLDEHDAQTWAITWSIVEKIETVGQKGRYFFRDALPQLRKFLVEEVERRLRDVSAGAA